jgi:hypothetical protein
MASSRLVVDLSNKSAQIIDSARRVTLFWSGVTRRTAAEKAAEAGWLVDGEWEHTSPPDGFSCPVRLDTASALAVLADAERDLAESYELVSRSVPNSHDAHNDLRLARDAFVTAFMRLRRAVQAEDTPWTVRHG